MLTFCETGALLAVAMTDRRQSWATINDPVLIDRISSHLDRSAEWEARIATMEQHFDRMIAKLDGMVKVACYSMSIIAMIVGVFGGSIVWYAGEREKDLKHLATTSARLATIAEVLNARQDRDEIDKDHLSERINAIEQRVNSK